MMIRQFHVSYAAGPLTPYCAQNIFTRTQANWYSKLLGHNNPPLMLRQESHVRVTTCLKPIGQSTVLELELDQVSQTRK